MSDGIKILEQDKESCDLSEDTSIKDEANIEIDWDGDIQMTDWNQLLEDD